MGNRRDEFVFSLYKPLRNQLSSYNLIDSLQLIWGYSRNYTFNLPLPSDIQHHPKFSPSDDIFNRRLYGLKEFELELLMKEFIINCNLLPAKHSLKEFKNFTKLIIYLHSKLQEEIDKNFTTKGDILLEFNRMAHSQFKWQLGYDQKIIFRYNKVFADNDDTGGDI